MGSAGNIYIYIVKFDGLHIFLAKHAFPVGFHPISPSKTSNCSKQNLKYANNNPGFFNSVCNHIYIYMSAILHRPGDPETMDVSDWTTLLTGKEATNLEKYREKLLVRKDRVRVFHVFPFETYLWGGAEVLILCVCVCSDPFLHFEVFFLQIVLQSIYIYIDTVHV